MQNLLTTFSLVISRYFLIDWSDLWPEMCWISLNDHPSRSFFYNCVLYQFPILWNADEPVPTKKQKVIAMFNLVIAMS